MKIIINLLKIIITKIIFIIENITLLYFHYFHMFNLKKIIINY